MTTGEVRRVLSIVTPRSEAIVHRVKLTGSGSASEGTIRWQAMNRQLKTESGKPSFDKVANTTDELIEINSLIN